MDAPVLLQVDGPIARVTLNRPTVLNALEPGMAAALLDVLQRLERDPSVRVVVLNGAGAAFMAGGDVKMFASLAPLPAEERRRKIIGLISTFHAIVLTLRRMPQPVIASVHGACAGGGLSLMAACDLVVAAASASFSLAYVRIATSPDGGSTHFLPRAIGQKRAMELALLSDRFDGARAEAIGLINRSVPDDRLAAETTAMAERLAKGPREAIARTKRLIRDSFEQPIEVQLQAELESFAEMSTTADFVEGVTAFAEKRAANFEP
ncbi:MAG: enoyl-CoA hydratase/isomerase family protein [Alphaproteobacteria bacterium]